MDIYHFTNMLGLILKNKILFIIFISTEAIGKKGYMEMKLKRLKNTILLP